MEHSPTLKLIHTSEVAPGASSAPFSSFSIDASKWQEDHALRNPNQEGRALGQADLKVMHGSKDGEDKEPLPAAVVEYRKEIQGLNKRLDLHTARLAELQQLVEKRTEKSKGEPELSSNHRRSSSKEEHNERGPISYLVEVVVYFLTGAACYFVGRYQAENIYLEKEYSERQKERSNPAPVPLNNCEHLNCEKKAEIRVTVERIIDGVPDKSFHPGIGTQQSDATELDTQSVKPGRSWSSHFWKKQ